MNYFEFFDIPVQFQLDEAQLKRQYYVNSKKYHPDFYTLESAEKQAEILQLSTLNNEAYNTLANFDTRMRYVLQLKGILAEEGQNTIPQDFLMSMMDINEALMELEFDNAPVAREQVAQQLAEQETSIYADITDIITNYDDAIATDEQLEKVKDYYLKKRYLLRIRENLNKFATL